MKTTRTTIKIIAILCVMIASVVGVLCFTGIFNGEPDNGKYYIVDNDKYKDAYVEVKGNKIQFHNIDLNDIYKEKMISLYNRVIERHPEDKISDEEYDEKFNINSWLVDNPFIIDYQLGGKQGTFVYNYHLVNGFFYSAVVIHYDSFHKTITLMRQGIEVKFAK